MQVIPVKRWIKDIGCCKILLEDHRRLVKGLWSIIFSIPAIVVVMFVKNPQAMVTYTGGFGGTFILLLIPMALVVSGRRALRIIGKTDENPNSSFFKSVGWVVLVLLFACMVIGFVIKGIVQGNAGE